MVDIAEVIEGQVTIQKLVFHLVGPAVTDYVRLQVLDTHQFDDFFIDRIRTATHGAPYRFRPTSQTEQRLRRIAANLGSFQTESEGLANTFQNLHRSSMAKGAFFAIALKAAQQQVFALLKYDDEKVLRYELVDGSAGRKRARVAAIERTFVQNRDALQKVALILLHGHGGDLLVLDRQSQQLQKVAQFFETFLDVERLFNDAEISAGVVNAARAVIRDNSKLVPPEVYATAYQRTYDVASSGARLRANDYKRYLETVIGKPLEDDDVLVQQFSDKLKRGRLGGAPVRLNVEQVQKPSFLRYVTNQNIRISVPSELTHLIEERGGQIIIKDRIVERADDTSRNR